MGTVGLLELLGTLVALTFPNQLSFLLQLLTIAANLSAEGMLRLIAVNSTTHLQVPKTGTLAKRCKNRTLSTIR